MKRIGNIAFIEKTRIDFRNPAYNHIYSAYKKPSQTKCKIYFQWLEWFNKYKTKGDFIEIVSPTCFTFTLQGKILGHKFLITKTHRYMQAHTLDDVTIE